MLVALPFGGLANAGWRHASPCGETGGVVLLERESGVVALDARSGQTASLAIAPRLAGLVAGGTPWSDWGTSPRWIVRREGLEHAYRIVIRDRAAGDVTLLEFNRRIELSSMAVSSSGQFTAFIQANNIASEVTLIDAASGESLMTRVPHNAGLAAFSIRGAFSSGEECLAVSMERVGGQGPQTWLIDVATGAVADAVPGFVIGWA